MSEELNIFTDAIKNALEKDNFVKLTFSKPPKKTNALQNVYVRQIRIKGEKKLSFTYRNKTNDQVKNGDEELLHKLLNELLVEAFRVVTLFTLEEDITLQISKKGKASLRKQDPTFKEKPPESHDKKKERKVERSPYLFHLGVVDKEGNVIPKMADKYRQINKYLEIIEGLIKEADLPNKINIVDMGSGKGYLTFALYDFLTHTMKKEVTVTGIELRKELVDFCNDVSKKCEYENLKFVSQRIEKFKDKKIDVLIALHACDTATDDAIYKGIVSNSKLIICAPCCHKQVRQSVKGLEQQSPILKYGIFKERQFEMVTDTIRALIMEKNQYQTKVFEFVSNEHTRKNIMMVGVKGKKDQQSKEIDTKIKGLMEQYHISNHYLEDALESQA